jgi:hypothetical protein
MTAGTMRGGVLAGAGGVAETGGNGDPVTDVGSVAGSDHEGFSRRPSCRGSAGSLAAPGALVSLAGGTTSGPGSAALAVAASVGTVDDDLWLDHGVRVDFGRWESTGGARRAGPSLLNSGSLDRSGDATITVVAT